MYFCFPDSQDWPAYQLCLYSTKHNNVLEPSEAFESVTTTPQHQNAENETWWLVSTSFAKESLNVIILREESDLHLRILLSYLRAWKFGIFLKEVWQWIPPETWMCTHIWLHVVILFFAGNGWFWILSAQASVAPVYCKRNSIFHWLCLASGSLTSHSNGNVEHKTPNILPFSCFSGTRSVTPSPEGSESCVSTAFVSSPGPPRLTGELGAGWTRESYTSPRTSHLNVPRLLLVFQTWKVGLNVHLLSASP